MQKRSKWQFIVDFIKRDWLRKVIALFLTLLLYGAIMPKAQEKKDTLPYIPINVELPPGWMLSKKIDIHPSLKVVAHPSVMKKTKSNNVTINHKIQLENIVPGEPYRLQLNNADVQGLDKNIRVEEISPDTILVHLEKVLSKELPVKHPYGPADMVSGDYEIKSIKFVPETVTVSGSERLLSSLDSINISYIPLGGRLRGNFSYECDLDIPAGIQCNQNKVTAQVEVNKVMTSRNFQAVPLLITQNAEHTRKFQVAKVEPETISVSAGGTWSTLKQLQSQDFNASIKLDKVDKPGQYELPVTVSTPAAVSNIKIKNFHPKTARITVAQE